MPDINFSGKDLVVFPTKYHGEVTLSKKKWHTICSMPERFYYKHNGEKIGTTLIAPDLVRHHSKNKAQFLYYKEFNNIYLNERVTAPAMVKYWVVVIDTGTGKACTAYPTEKVKQGKKYTPSKEGGK